jgi:hypothetical protein
VYRRDQAQSMLFRVFTFADVQQGPCGGAAAGTAAHPTPQLCVSTIDALGNQLMPWDPPNWQILAENVENMQLALILSDGTVCGAQGYARDDPATCNPQYTAGALGLAAGQGLLHLYGARLTLQVRSSSPIQGFHLMGAVPPMEDFPGVGVPGGQNAANDDYLRRLTTLELALRNFPVGP